MSKLNTFRTKRYKRGLINPLGSLIKSITGNLDYNDAIRYEEFFHILKKNNQDLTDSFNKHVTLYKQMTFHQTEVLKNISYNQIKLEKAFSYYVNSTSNSNEQIIRYAHLSQILIILNENVQDLLIEIDRIENIVAFSQSSTVHHSILSLHTINDMLSKLRNLYNQNQIINFTDIRYYYNLISLGCYFVENKLIIVLKFPIVTSLSYNLYHLCPVPNKDHVVIIPPSPYIATNSKEYAYMEAECPKFDTVYICSQQMSFQTRTRRDCIFRLIHLQEIDETCSPTPIALSKEALMELDNQHYIVSFQQPTKIQMICGQERHQTIEGSFLVTIPISCSMKTPEFTITNVNDKIRGGNFEILTFPQEDLQALSSSNNRKPYFNITAIDLNKLHELQNQLTMEHSAKINDIDWISTYHTTIPFYVLVIPCIIAIFILYYLRRRSNRIKDGKNSKIEIALQPCSATPEQPSAIKKDRKAAIFALDAGK